MQRADLEDEAAFARRLLGEIEIRIARLRESIDDKKRRDVIANAPDIFLLEMLQQMRVMHALHLQWAMDELRKPEPPRKIAKTIYGIIASGRAAGGFMEVIPSRNPD